MIMKVCYVRPYKGGAFVTVYLFTPDMDAPRCHEGVYCVGFCPTIGQEIRVVWSSRKKKRYGFVVTDDDE